MLWFLMERAFDFGPHADLRRAIREDTREMREAREQRQAAKAQVVANRDREAMRDLHEMMQRGHG